MSIPLMLAKIKIIIRNNDKTAVIMWQTITGTPKRLNLSAI